MADRYLNAPSWWKKRRGTKPPKSAGSGNRRERRAFMREIKRLTRPIFGCRSMYHPVLVTKLTPHGRKVLASRRRRNKAARLARKKNWS